MAALVAACDTAAIPEPEDAALPVFLVDHAAWSPLGPSEDLFQSHRPEVLDCADGAISEALGVLEIEMNLCNYVSLGQPLARGLARGEVLRFSLWHLQLWNVEPAEAHLAFALGEDTLVEYAAPVPSPARIESRDVVLGRDYAAGTMVQLHLHNHGDNHWRIGPVELTR